MRKPPGVPNELFKYEREKRCWTQGNVADKINVPDVRLIRRWESGEVTPSPHNCAKLAEVFGKSARALGFPPDGQISFWRAPYGQNAFFTGRDDILPGKDEANPEQLIEALKEWLTQLTRWLLIFDNVEDFQLLDDFQLTEMKGHVLLTTLSQSTGTYADCIAVEPMDNNTGAELLLHRAKLIALESALEHIAAADVAIARSLSEDMGGLPLALDQAGAYVEETAMSLSEYVQRYQKQRRNLLHRRGLQVSEYSEHPLPVAATFKLSLEKACERDLIAADILNFCAFLHPDAIPEELFLHDESFKYGTMAFDESIAVLLRYSLIKRNTQEQTFSMHRLEQAVLIEDMLSDIRKQWRERVARALSAAFPEAEYRNWRLCERLVPHALKCATWTKDELTPTAEVAALFQHTGAYLHVRGQYQIAEKLTSRALLIFQQHFGDEHISTAMAMNNLASTYIQQGKDEQAEPLLVRARAIYEQQLEAEDPHVTFLQLALANFYRQQGKYEQAEHLYLHTITILEKRFGPEHPELALDLWRLALILHNFGRFDDEAGRFMQAGARYEQAGALYQRSISILEQLEDPDIQTVQELYTALLHDLELSAEAQYRQRMTGR